ncbi:MAG: IS110 family transposase [Gemmatimonadales bacterium]
MSTSDDGRFQWFVGVDWAVASHQVCVLDAQGTLRGEYTVAHTLEALTAWVARLRQLTEGALPQVAVAIEVPRGAVVEFLLEQGASVFTLNPKQVDRFRDRYTVAGAKDDRRDARVLASALRTDRPAFRPVAVDDPRIIQLRELSRMDDDLAAEQNRLLNRLREQVYRMAAPWLVLSPSAGDPWFWALLERVPSPAAAARSKRRVIDAILRSHRIRRVTTEEVLAVLHTPVIATAPGTVAAATRHIAALLPRLRLVHDQRRGCAKEIDALLASLADGDPPSAADSAANRPSDGAIVQSMPGIGRMVAATLWSEAATLLRLRHYAGLRALSGLAPVTRQSGGRRAVGMRHACNAHLREACYHWARTSTVFEPGSKHYYATLRARGHSHGRALRSVADRLLRMLMAMLRTHTLFDPSRVRTSAEPVPA